MLVGDDDLHEVQDAIESRDVTKQEQPSVCTIEVIVDRSGESFAGDDYFRVAPVANFQHDGFRPGKNISVRKLDNSQRPGGKNVTSKRRVGSRASDGDKITARVFDVRLDARKLARIPGQRRIHVSFKIPEHGKRAFVIDARIDFRV